MAKRVEESSEDPSALRLRIRQLEEELKARDEFLIAAAHELRNPISPLMLHVQRMSAVARNASDGTVQARWVSDQLETFGRRLVRFTMALNRILDISSMQTGRIHLVLEQVDLAEVVRDVVFGFEREIEASQCTLTLDADVATVGTWDRLRLEQIVSNLVSNAIRYGNSSPIEVSLKNHGETAVLCVADHGIGIAEADQARIFERFERAHKQYRSGFGVGLWVVHQLCEVMGGSVNLESCAGEGSTFRVTLPTNRDGSGDDR